MYTSVIIDQELIRVFYQKTHLEIETILTKERVSGYLLKDTDTSPLDLNFIKTKWDGEKWYEGATNEEIAQQKLREAKALETIKYKQRALDGQDKYAELSAEFRLAKLSGQIDEQTHSSIEEALIPIRNEVLAGQWRSGLDKLELLGSKVIGESLYNKLHNDLQTYIINSYGGNNREV